MKKSLQAVSVVCAIAVLIAAFYAVSILIGLYPTEVMLFVLVSVVFEELYLKKLYIAIKPNPFYQSIFGVVCTVFYGLFIPEGAILAIVINTVIAGFFGIRTYQGFKVSKGQGTLKQLYV